MVIRKQIILIGAVVALALAYEAPAASAATSSAAAKALARTASGKTTNLVYHGGPVMHTNTTYAIYWVPPPYKVASGYEQLIDRYLSDVAQDNGSLTNVYSVPTQYSDGGGFVASNSTFAGSYIDTNPFPPSGCSYPTKIKISTCLTDAQLGTELSSVLFSQRWPRGLNNLYLLFLPKNVGACHAPLGSPLESCSEYAFTGICGWHDAAPWNPTQTWTPFAVIPYSASDVAGLSPSKGCAKGGESPNGNDADASINVLSHEAIEALTDPLASGWYAGKTPGTGEIGDKCAWNFGTAPLGGRAGTYYNQVINGDHYWLQGEWSNAISDCSWGAASSSGSGALVFDGSVGAAAPPATLGGYPIQKFGTDPQPVDSNVSSVTGPTGAITFSSALTHLLVPSSWATWSNGYTGDVYAAIDGVTTSVLITLPAGTHAFYLYAEPNVFSSFTISATGDDGTSSGPIDVQGYAGAHYYGFYSPRKNHYVKSILMTCSDPLAEGFAVGEFGIG